jgi:sporulation protein YlmC with PRC-barrel domain
MSGATFMQSQQASDWRGSKLIGATVYGTDNSSIGEVNDLVLASDGKINGVVIGVGGFLGVGEHLVALPFDKVKFVNEPVAYTGVAGTRPGSTTTTGAAKTTPAATPAKANPWYPDHAVISATKDQLKAMPQFKYAI